MRWDSILFDLDGTLWDATPTTVAAWEEVLRTHPDVTPAMPIDRKLVQSNMGRTNEEVAGILFPEMPFRDAFRLVEESCAWENRWLPQRGGVLYDGVEAGIAALAERGIPLAIVSNCQDGYVQAFLTAHGMWENFRDFESSGHSGRGKADNIRAVIERNGFENPVYVGDTDWDRQAAEEAGVPFLYAAYGFGETLRKSRVVTYAGRMERFCDLFALLK